MASVTFPPSLGGSGLTVTDDDNPTTGLGAGGHRLRFVPALAETVIMAQTSVSRSAIALAQANIATTKASESSASAATAANQAAIATQKAQEASDIISQAGSAAYRNVGTEAGNLMEVGAFGLGTVTGAVPLPGNDANNALISGFYKTDENTINMPPELPIGAHVLRGTLYVGAGLNANTTTVLFMSSHINRVYSRNRNAGAWGGWQRVYNQGSIIGEVSQSGGVPTGAIIERGSNSDGGYVKFADGTLIAKTIDFLTPINNLIGSGYRTENIIGNLPATFSNIPMVSGNCTSGQAIWVSSRAVNSTQFSFYGNYWVSVGTDQTFNLTAIGRWF